MSGIGENKDAFRPSPTRLPPTPDTRYKRTIREGIDRSSPAGIRDLNLAATDIFVHDVSPKAVNILGTTPEKQAIVMRALNTHDFPPKFDDDAQKRLLFQTVAEKESVARGLILKELQRTDIEVTFGLKPYEVEMLKATCKIADTYDQLAKRWLGDVRDNPANEKAKELGLKNPYAVIVGDEEKGYKEIAWVDQYPEQIGAIANEWRGLATKLADQGEAGKKLAAYFETYATALTSKGTKVEMETVWKDVDRTWMDIELTDETMLHPVGSRETGYYDKNRIRIFPDMRLMVRVDDLSDQVIKTGEALRKYIAQDFGDFEVYKKTANGLQKVKVFPGVDAVISGAVDFQAPGQNLPNDDEVMREKGTKVLINKTASVEKWKYSKEAAYAIFAQDHDLIDSVQPVRNGAAVRLAGHEFAEPLFQPKELEAILGEEDLALHNEDLADGATGSIMRRRRDIDGDLDNNDLMRHAVNHLCIYARHLKEVRGNPTHEAYYKSTLQGLRRMLTSGFVSKVDGNWKIDVTKLEAYYDIVEKDLKTQVQIHEDALVKDDKEDAKTRSKAYLAQAQETPEIQELIKIVNPEAEFEEVSK